MNIPAKRYPGSRPFDDTVADRRIFFGRKEEILALSNRILGARLILLFARSGVGKTSLLSAGVAPQLREHALLPCRSCSRTFSRRFRAGAAGSPADRVIDAVIAACSAQGLRLVTGERTGLWEFFKTSLIWQQDTLLTPVLVFDQFEEVFTLTQGPRVAPRIGPRNRLAAAARLSRPIGRAHDESRSRSSSERPDAERQGGLEVCARNTSAHCRICRPKFPAFSRNAFDSRP